MNSAEMDRQYQIALTIFNMRKRRMWLGKWIIHFLKGLFLKYWKTSHRIQKNVCYYLFFSLYLLWSYTFLIEYFALIVSRFFKACSRWVVLHWRVLTKLKLFPSMYCCMYFRFSFLMCIQFKFWLIFYQFVWINNVTI